jgi:hypothetical protein
MQIDPLDPTRILQTDVTALRTSLLSIRGFLEEASEDMGNEALLSIIRRAGAEVDNSLILRSKI